MSTGTRPPPGRGGTGRRVSVDPSVFAAVPGYRRVVLTCAVADAAVGATAMADQLAAAARILRGRYDPTALAAAPAVAAWRRAFRAVGLHPAKFRPAAEALARRALRGDPLTFTNALVDLGTAVSLAHLVPVGVHTVDDLIGDLSLEPATGDELFTPFAGPVEHPAPGELIYRSGATVLTRRWVWRQGAVGSVRGADPVRLAVNLDLLTENGDPRGALGQLIELLRLCGATRVNTVVLSAHRPRARLAWTDATERDCGAAS